MKMRAFWLAILACLAGAPLPASGEHGDPWYTVEKLPALTGFAPGAVFIGGGGFDVSEDGRYVARVGTAPEDYPDCHTSFCYTYWVTDRETGLSQAIAVAWDGYSPTIVLPEPSISDGGRYLGVFSEEDGIFVYDRQAASKERVDVSSGGTAANKTGYNRPDISADGRFVAFPSNATNLVPGDTAQCEESGLLQDCTDVFVRDREAGETELVSVASDGTPSDGVSFDPAISADGRFVAFVSRASNLDEGEPNEVCQGGQVGQVINCQDIYLHDRQTGETKLVSANTLGLPANGNSSDPSISADGRFVAFASEASDLVEGDTNRDRDVFVRDMLTGITERVSVTSAEQQTNDGFGSANPSISSDGMRVAFESDSADLDPGAPDTCIPGVKCGDIFVRERDAGKTYKANVSLSGAHANGRSSEAVMSGDGRHVIFSSAANNLLEGVESGSYVAEREDTGPTPSPTLAPRTLAWGDVNCSGGVDSVDALGLLRYVAGLSVSQTERCPNVGTAVEVLGAQRAWGDVDCSGAVDSVDSLKVLRYVAGLSAPAPAGCPGIGETVEVTAPG